MDKSLLYYQQDDGGDPIPTDDLHKWAESFATPEGRVVAVDMVGSIRVSTVFLGLDHHLTGEGPPILWETMVFGGKMDQRQWRYDSVLDAMEGHGKVLRLVQLTEGEETI